MKVLHVAQPSSGGVAGYLRGAAIHQARSNVAVYAAIAPDFEGREDLIHAGVAVYEWRASRDPVRPSMRAELMSLAEIIRRVDPDVVHLHSSKAGFIGRIAVRGTRQTIFQPHAWSWQAARGCKARASLAWERFARRWTTRYICVGRSELDEGELKLGRLPAEVIENGVDLDHFRPAAPHIGLDARDRLGVSRQAFLAVCIGRRSYQKGQDVLLRAWAQFADSHQGDAKLLLVGDREDGGVEVTGRMRASGVLVLDSQKDIRSFVAASNLIVMPSRWEGMPLTLLEVLAMEARVLVSDIPAAREVAVGGTAMFAGVGDASAIAHVLLNEASGREDVWLASWRTESDRFAIERTYSRLLDLTRGVGGIQQAVESEIGG